MQCDVGMRARMKNPASVPDKFARLAECCQYALGYLLDKLGFHVQFEFTVTIVIFRLLPF